MKHLLTRSYFGVNVGIAGSYTYIESKTAYLFTENLACYHEHHGKSKSRPSRCEFSIIEKSQTCSNIFHGKMKCAKEQFSEIQSKKELTLLEKDNWRSISELPDDHYLDQESGRLSKVNDWSSRALIAQRERGYDFQISEVLRSGEIVFFSRPQDSQSVFERILSESGEYLQFLLHCYHISTVQALTILSEASKISIDKFSVYQIFDKTTVNTQLCSIQIFDKNADILQCISYINNNPQVHIKITPLRRTNARQAFGSHRGNYCSLLVRHCKAPVQTVHSRVKALEFDGFVNYYPQKYFGYGTYGNHLVGAVVLQGKYGQALAMIAQDECESIRNRDQSLGFSKGFYVSHVPWLKEIISVLENSFADEDEYRSTYLNLPAQIRWKHLLGIRCFTWNLSASARMDQGRSKTSSDLIGNCAVGISLLPADCFDNFESHRFFVRMLGQRGPAKVEKFQSDKASKEETENLHRVVLPFRFGGLDDPCPESRGICKFMRLPMHSWNKTFGFPSDPVLEYRPIISSCHTVNMYSIPEGYCDSRKIDIGIKTDTQLSPKTKFTSCATRLPGKLYDIALSRNTLLGNWGKIGHRSYLMGFGCGPCTNFSSALREMLHLDRPYDHSKSLRSLMNRAKSSPSVGQSGTP